MTRVMPSGAQWRKAPIEGKGALVHQVVAALKAADDLVVCTDAGREGELIAMELIEYAGCLDKPRRRLWTSVMNQEGLKAALAALRDGRSTYGLWQAGVARERIDFMEGMTFSRVMALKDVTNSDDGVSVGRVQSPALGFIVEREEAIEGFRPQDYYGLKATATDGQGRTVVLRHEPKEKVLDGQVAQAMAARCEGRDVVLSMKTERRREAPPKPMDLAAAQAWASKKLGWPAQKTLDVAQSLYDGHGALSYPRTDATAYDPSEWATCRKALEQLKAQGYEAGRHAPAPADALQRPKVFSEKALEGCDHGALMPTGTLPSPGTLSSDERTLLEKVAARFVAQMLPDRIYDHTRIAAEVDGIRFEATGQITRDEGWRRAERPEPKKAADGADEEAPEGALPPVEDGAQVKLQPVEVAAKRTKCPQRLGEGELVELMKRKGVGTQSTWAATIEKNKERRNAVADAKGKLSPTGKGRTTVAWMRGAIPAMVTPERTGALEAALKQVEQGKLEGSQVVDAAVADLRRDVDKVRGAAPIALAAGVWRYRKTDEGEWRVRTVLAKAEVAARSAAGTRVEAVNAKGKASAVLLGAVAEYEEVGPELVRIECTFEWAEKPDAKKKAGGKRKKWGRKR